MAPLMALVGHRFQSRIPLIYLEYQQALMTSSKMFWSSICQFLIEFTQPKACRMQNRFIDFLRHSHSSHYVFQIKKMWRLILFLLLGTSYNLKAPLGRFLKLNFLLLPLLNVTWEHYQNFENMYGNSPSEKDRPSFVATPPQEPKDKNILTCLLAQKWEPPFTVVNATNSAVYIHNVVTVRKIKQNSKYQRVGHVYTHMAQVRFLLEISIQ